MDNKLKQLLGQFLEQDALKDQVIATEFMARHKPLFLSALDVLPNSKDVYKRQLRRFKKYLAVQEVKSITRETILGYKDFLQNQKQNGKILNPSTVTNYINTLRVFFRYLDSVGAVQKDPTKGIKPLRRNKSFKKEALSIPQISKLYKSIKRTPNLNSIRDYAIINLMTMTGLRTIEIVRADWQDIIIKDKKMVMYIHGKGRAGKDEFIILEESVYKPIQDYRSAKIIAIGKSSVAGNAPIFSSHSRQNLGSRLTTRSISRLAKDRLINSGLNHPKLTAHSFRHTAVTLALTAGSTIQEVMMLARHASIATTMIYAHNIDRMIHSPEEKIAELLKKELEE